MTTKKKLPKFVQIATNSDAEGNESLYALDADGGVWRYTPSDWHDSMTGRSGKRGWHPLDNTRHAA